MAVFHIRLLGGWQLERHGQARDPPPPRLQALLAYLLLHRDAPQSRAHLSFLLWPDSKEAQARTNLRQSLHHLRRELPETTAFLRVDGRHLQWRPDSSCTVDVPQFERTLERAAAAEAADGIEEARVCFERAVEIYGGALLPHLYEP